MLKKLLKTSQKNKYNFYLNDFSFALAENSLVFVTIVMAVE